MDEFVNIKLEKRTLDKYTIRRAIFGALQEAMPLFTGQFLDVGCGQMPYKDCIIKQCEVSHYTGLDLADALVYDEQIQADAVWDGVQMPFEAAHFDCAMATEVLEHCPEPEVTLQEVYRVLKPGGVFFFTVPFLWNLHEVPHDAYRYTPFSLERHLQHSGFVDIRLQATGGWHAAMAQMLGLWVRRSYMGTHKREVLSYLLQPVIKRLLAYDRPKQVVFKEGQMITGLSGIAYKPKAL